MSTDFLAARTYDDPAGKRKAARQTLPPQKHNAAKSLLFIITLFLGCFLIVKHTHYSLPSPQPASYSFFSEERAREHVRFLSDLGPKEVGTLKEQTTIRYILDNIEKARNIKTNEWLKDFEVQVMSVDGQHRFDILGHPILKTYQNVTNILVKMGCGSDCDKNALLINTHFDTIISSPGASDAGAPTAVMLELIRVLSTNNVKFRNSVIFLFNGAEESLQDASHGFITQHKWKDSVKAVLNLEACGQGGKAILFQALSPLMVEAYSKVSWPHGSVLAHDFFSTGIVSSDTDFRQFVDHGNVKSGLDIAYYKNSYVYHTHLDLEETIDKGAIQHMGDSSWEALNWVVTEANMDTIKDHEDEVVVYFDFLGLVFVHYPILFARFLHTMTITLSMIFVVKQAQYLASTTSTNFSPAFKHFVKCFLGVFLSLFTGVIASVMLGITMKMSGQSQRWFRRVWMPAVLFLPLTIAGVVFGQYLVYKWNRTSRLTSFQERISFLSLLTFYTVSLYIFTYFNLGSGYVPFICSVAILLALFSSPATARPLPLRTYFIAWVIPTLMSLDIVIAFLDLLVPLTGRMGGYVPHDSIMAVFIAVVGFLPLSILIPFVHRFTASQIMQLIKLTVIYTFVVGILFTFNPRFDALHPQRYYIQHAFNVTDNTSALYVALADGAPFNPEFNELIDSLTGSKPELVTSNIEVEAMTSLYPFDRVIKVYRWNTTKFNGRFWTDESGVLGSVTDFADIHEPVFREGVSIKSIRKVGEENGQIETQREISIPCDMNRHNMWTVIQFNADVAEWSIPNSEPFGHSNSDYFLRLASGGGGWSDMRGIRKKVLEELKYTKEGKKENGLRERKCDFWMKVRDEKVRFLIVATPSELGKGNYLLRRLQEKAPQEVTLFVLDSIVKVEVI